MLDLKYELVGQFEMHEAGNSPPGGFAHKVGSSDIPLLFKEG
jgi:hypothetical protein